MNSFDANDQQHNDLSSTASYPHFVPMTPKSSEIVSLKASFGLIKPPATKTILEQTIKALSTKSRKGFSLANIRKYILENYLHAPSEIKHRLPYIKKFLKTALESGEIVSVKGVGLTGSFRVPRLSRLHKNAKKATTSKVKKLSRKTAKKIIKKDKKQREPSLKAKKVKKPKRIFSANS